MDPVFIDHCFYVLVSSLTGGVVTILEFLGKKGVTHPLSIVLGFWALGWVFHSFLFQVVVTSFPLWH